MFGFSVEPVRVLLPRHYDLDQKENLGRPEFLVGTSVSSESFGDTKVVEVVKSRSVEIDGSGVKTLW